MPTIDLPTAFTGQEYLNLETYRRNGEAVRTPVWFAVYENSLCVRTQTNSGKIKRIRNQPQVRVAPCKADGTPVGEWRPAVARLATPEEAEQISAIFYQKYRMRKKLFDLLNRLRRQTFQALVIDAAVIPGPK